jgi:hypothetical protein
MSGWGGRSEGSSCGTSWTRWGELFLLENFTGNWALASSTPHSLLSRGSSMIMVLIPTRMASCIVLNLNRGSARCSILANSSLRE